jgi:hypothetical protein
MRSLLWKEWRENFKWIPRPALLILVPFVGLLGMQSLMDMGLLFYVSLVAALFGAALGFVQTFPEARGDKRSLLLHRPMTPTQIFLGKAIAGLEVYLFAMGIPVAFLTAMAALPGHIAKPFSWRTVLPMTADVLTGSLYYFGGMLAAQCAGRWYGSKSLGLAAAFCCSIVVWIVPEFWHALSAIVIIGGFAAAAAWGSFLTGGAYAPQPRLAKVSFAITCLIGVSTVGFLGNYFVCRWLEPHNNYSYSLDRKGGVLVVHFTDRALSVTDMEGRTPPELEEVQQDDFHALEEMSAQYVTGPRPRLRSYRSWRRFHIEHRNPSRLPSEDWFYVPDKGRLLGYNRGTKLLIGSFGPDGFVPAGEPTADRFEGEVFHGSAFPKANTPDYLAFPKAVYRVDFHNRTVQRLFVPARGETVLWADKWRIEKENLSPAFIGTDKSFHVLDEAGSELLSAPLASDLENHRVARVGRLEDPVRFWVWYEPMCFLDLDVLEKMPAYVVQYDANGNEIARTTLPPRPGGARATGPREPYNEPTFTPGLAGLITPPAEAGAIVGATRFLVSEAGENKDTERPILLPFLQFTTQFFIPGVRWAPAAHPGLLFGFVALMLFSSVMCAVVCFLMARRHSFSRVAVATWALQGLAFGWVGLVVMLALHEWPARIVCPNCRKLRAVTKDICEHCCAPHVVPAPDGTEIIELRAPTPSPVLMAQ